MKQSLLDSLKSKKVKKKAKQSGAKMQLKKFLEIKWLSLEKYEQMLKSLVYGNLCKIKCSRITMKDSCMLSWSTSVLKCNTSQMIFKMELCLFNNQLLSMKKQVLSITIYNVTKVYQSMLENIQSTLNFMQDLCHGQQHVLQ